MKKSISEPGPFTEEVVLNEELNQSSFVSVTRFSKQISYTQQSESKTSALSRTGTGSVFNSTSDLQSSPFQRKSNAVGVSSLTKADVLRRELPRISPELPKLRNGRFTSDERLCFRKYPFPSPGKDQKSANFWRTTGQLRMAMSESGLHMIPRSKGDFWCSGEFNVHRTSYKEGSSTDALRRRGAVFAGTEDAQKTTVLAVEGPTARILDEIYPTVLPPSREEVSNSSPAAAVCAQERLKVVINAGAAYKDSKEAIAKEAKKPLSETTSNMLGERSLRGAGDISAEDRKKAMVAFRLKILDKYSSIGEAFDSLDCDLSKSLTTKEWNNTLYNAGLASYRDARALFDIVDEDKSGEVTVTEFYIAIEQVTPIRTIEDLRKRLLASGYPSMLAAITAMDNLVQDRVGQPGQIWTGEIPEKRLSFSDFAFVLKAIVNSDDEENAAVFLAVRDSNSEDNTISTSELATALAVVSPCLLIEDLRDKLLQKFQTLSVAWDRIDIDKSGDVNAFEFTRHARKTLGLSLTEAQKLFRWIDCDSSGQIARSEFISALNLSSSSLQLEDFRLKVRQRFRSIHNAFLGAFSESDEGLLDNNLQLSPTEFGQILESIEVSPKDTQKLFHLVDTDRSGTLTLREFFRGIEVFAPSCLLEGIQLQILRRQKNGTPSDAFNQVPISRTARMDLNAFKTFLEDHKLIKGVKVGPLFDLLDVRSDGGVTLGELIAALQCVQPGTMVKLSPEERDLQVKIKVRGDLAPYHKTVAEMKLQVRAGLSACTPLKKGREKKTEENAEAKEGEPESGTVEAAESGQELINFEDRSSTVAQQSFARLNKTMGTLDHSKNKSDTHDILKSSLRTYFGSANRMLIDHGPLVQQSYSRYRLHERTQYHKNLMKKKTV